VHRLGNIIKKFVQDYGLGTGLELFAIRKEWHNLVGQTLAAHTFPDSLKSKTIFINVDTPQWLHHLGFYKQEILEKLKAYNITEVRFKLGKLPPPPATNHDDNASTLSDEDLEYIEGVIKSVKNEELRERFRTLLIHALTKGRHRSY
jgi:hypothetical protein